MSSTYFLMSYGIFEFTLWNLQGINSIPDSYWLGIFENQPFDIKNKK